MQSNKSKSKLLKKDLKTIILKIDQIEQFISYLFVTRPLSNDWYPIPDGRDNPPFKNIKDYGTKATYGSVSQELIDALRKEVKKCK